MQAGGLFKFGFWREMPTMQKMNVPQEPLMTDQLFSRNQQKRRLFLNRQLCVVGCALVFGLFIFLRLLEPLENAFLDAWLSISKTDARTDVVLVPISGKSLDQIGKWPWPPFRHAVMIEFLQRMGARSVYISHNFSERGWDEDEKALVTVLDKKAIPVFFAADFIARFENTGPGLETITADKNPQMIWAGPSAEVSRLVFLGHRQLAPDRDRVFRFWKPAIEKQEKVYPLAALKMARELSGEHERYKKWLQNQNENNLIPWDRGHFENWPRFEFADLIQSYFAVREGMQPTIDPKRFEGKDIFIGLAEEGATLSGLTPWHQTVFPYEVMAMIYDGLKSPGARVLKGISFWSGIVLFMLAATLLFFWTGLRLGRVYWLVWAAFIALIAAGWAAANFFSVWLPVVLPVLFLLTAGGAVFVFDALHARQEHSALFHLATRDGLTNLYVIRHFRVIMNQMTREAVMRKESLAVILMDIDHFKKINDTYGHPAGDMVLKKTAELIQTAVRQKRTLKEVDFVARYGGEEFIILVRRNSLRSTADRIAERIRTSIQSAEFNWNGTKISVTTSLGVATLREGEKIPDPMVHRADKALYLAKQSGRNCVRTESDIQE